MKVIKTAKQHIVVLSRGEELIESLISHCKIESIDAAWVTAIGAVSEVELALYDLMNKEYHRQKFSKPLEIASLSGNISLFNGQTTAHLHAIFSDQDMHCFGGHLSQAVVAATCELKLEIISAKLKREHDAEIGLNLLV